MSKKYNSTTSVDLKIWHFLAEPLTADTFIAELIHTDEHGLLGWFFKGNGQHETLTQQLRDQHPAVWGTCLAACRYR